MGLFGTARLPSDRKKRAPYHMRNSFQLLLGHDERLYEKVPLASSKAHPAKQRYNLSKLFYCQSRLFPEDIEQVVEENKHHQRHEEHQSDHVNQAFLLGRYRLAADDLHKEEHESAAV